jgi:hypothetical protein
MAKTRQGAARGQALPPELVELLRVRLVAIGEVAVGHEIGIGYTGVLRAAAGLGVCRTTYAAIATWAAARG